jgi:hypothetical protein
MEKIDVCDGKYTLVYDERTGAFKALRNGEAWQNLLGNKMVYALFCEIQELRASKAVESPGTVPAVAAVNTAMDAITAYMKAYESKVMSSSEDRMVAIAAIFADVQYNIFKQLLHQ